MSANGDIESKAGLAQASEDLYSPPIWPQAVAEFQLLPR